MKMKKNVSYLFRTAKWNDSRSLVQDRSHRRESEELNCWSELAVQSISVAVTWMGLRCTECDSWKHPCSPFFLWLSQKLTDFQNLFYWQILKEILLCTPHKNVQLTLTALSLLHYLVQFECMFNITTELSLLLSQLICFYVNFNKT